MIDLLIAWSVGWSLASSLGITLPAGTNSGNARHAHNSKRTISISMMSRPNPGTGSHKSEAKAPMSAEQVRKHFVLDTNVLLHNPQSIFKFEEHQVVIPLTVLEELDTFKKNNDEKGRNARQVIRSLDRLRGVGHLFEGVVWNEQGGSIRVMRFKPSANYDLDLSITDNRIIGIDHRDVPHSPPPHHISDLIDARLR